MRRTRLWLAVIYGVCALAGFASLAAACTGIRVRTTDGSVIAARTMEFGVDLMSEALVIPRGTSYTGTLGKAADVSGAPLPGVQWTSKYGVVGANGFGLPQIVDGLNEKGLGAGIFYFPGYAAYPAVTPDMGGRALAPWELVTWMLGNFATVAEVRAGLDTVTVCSVVQDTMGFVPPCHYVVYDATGACLVIEYVDGQRHVYDNPTGVITNAPTFDWHLTNLANYVNLSPTNVPPIVVDGRKIVGFGQGSGLLRMPGDFTPPSRFVRAVVLTQTAAPVATGPEGVSLAAHILNSFDIIIGLVRDDAAHSATWERTVWTSYKDLTGLGFYFRTYGDHRIRKVDLKQIDFSKPGLRSAPMDQKEAFEELTPAAK